MHVVNDFNFFTVPSVLNAELNLFCLPSFCSPLCFTAKPGVYLGVPPQVESLQALLKDKTEDYSVLLSVKEKYQRDLEDRNEEIDKMASRIRELEQALLSSTEAGRAVTQLEQELHKARKSLQELSQVQLV